MIKESSMQVQACPFIAILHGGCQELRLIKISQESCFATQMLMDGKVFKAPMSEGVMFTSQLIRGGSGKYPTLLQCLLTQK